MPNRRLTNDELERLADPLLAEVRAKLQQLSDGDASLLWALRRKIAKELGYDERGKPMYRKVLKATKRGEQQNKCAVCGCDLPERNVVLDRFEIKRGNARLLRNLAQSKPFLFAGLPQFFT